MKSPGAGRLLVAIALLAVFQALAGGLCAAPLDPLLQRTDLWAMNQAAFVRATGNQPFRWSSATGESARASHPSVTLFGIPTAEVVARFESAKLSRLVINLYARGDVGDLTAEQFAMVVTMAQSGIQKFTRLRGEARGKDERTAVKAELVLWKTPSALYRLEYSATPENRAKSIPFRAEFVRLEVLPPSNSVSILATASLGNKAAFVGTSRLQRDTSGDVWIRDVPMVDQGMKGYCAVACAERVMRYFGLSADANEFAQVANADAEVGTSLEGMLEAINRIGSRLKVRMREVQKLDRKFLVALVEDYNRAAKKRGQAPLNVRGPIPDTRHLYSSMDPTTLREARSRDRSKVDPFFRAVKEQIDRGLPVLWTVQLGVIPEPQLPQIGGGHMRLIIGYNAKSEELIYSDTWGAGHEKKRMNLGDAWTMTTSACVMEPGN